MQITNNIFEKIFKIYSKIKISSKNKDFYNLDKITYYYADEKQSKIVAKNVYEVDIHAAFPTICNLMFDKNDPFIIKLNSLTEKLDKNKHISITLKDTPYLKQLNYIAKMIISSCVMAANPENEIFELKKDGIVFVGDEIKQTEVYKYYTDELGFNIRETKYNIYIRYYKTSYYVTDNDVIIKGIYKDRPPFLKEQTNKILLENICDELELDKKYSNKYFNIIKYCNLDELFFRYYVCNQNKYLTSNFKYDKIKILKNCDILPKNYLKLFIYPLMVI